MPTTSFRQPEQTLISNGFTLSSAPNRLGGLVSTQAGVSMQTIRELYQTHGYVWLKGFFSSAEIMAFRGHFFRAFKDSGLLKSGSDPLEGIYSGDEDANITKKILMEFVRTAAYESFCLHPKLWQFYDSFFKNPSFLHKRKIIRYMPPGNTSTTPAHYDLIYLRGGTDEVVSSWIPLGDTSIENGLTGLLGRLGCARQKDGS